METMPEGTTTQVEETAYPDGLVPVDDAAPSDAAVSALPEAPPWLVRSAPTVAIGAAVGGAIGLVLPGVDIGRGILWGSVAGVAFCLWRGSRGGKSGGGKSSRRSQGRQAPGSALP